MCKTKLENKIYYKFYLIIQKLKLYFKNSDVVDYKQKNIQMCNYIL